MVLSCAGNSSVKSTAETANDSHPSAPLSQATADDASSAGDDITGYWKLFLEAYDDNNNRKLDEEERKKGIKNRYSFRFNADGSCEIMDAFKGRYEVKTESGKRILRVFRNRVVGEEEKDPPPDVYEITSLANQELVLLENLGDHTFWVFRR